MTDMLTTIEAPKLNPVERAALLTAINAVRAGIFTLDVAFLYDKQTTAKPRVAGVDYMALPGDAGKLHVGVLVAAPTNKAGEVYLRVLDTARGNGSAGAQWTTVKLCGIKGFQVRAVRAGPKVATPAS